MDDKAAARLRAAIAEKDLRYFSSHTLGGLLEGIGEDGTTRGILDAVGRLAEDEDSTYEFLEAVASGLREALDGGEEYAALASRVASAIRPGIAQGPVVRSLIEAAKDNPRRALAAAARLIDLGDADYAAFLAAGAYAGEPDACESMAESLLSSGDPRCTAAGASLLRVARLEHGAPGAARVIDAAGRAMQAVGEPAWSEAMESLLDAYGEDPKRAGPMIDHLAAARPETLPLLAVRIGSSSPFGTAAEALRYLDMCMAGARPGDDSAAYDICRALAALAAGEAAGVARRMLGLVLRREYRMAHGWRVFEGLGKASTAAAATAAEEVVAALRRPDAGDIRPHLPQIVRSLGRHADMDSLAAPFLAALKSDPDALDDCLAALGALAEENRLSRKDAGFARSLLGRLRGIGARAGRGDRSAAKAALGQDPHAACSGLIERMRRAAVGKTDLVLLILRACNGRPVAGIRRLDSLAFLAQAEGSHCQGAPLGGPFDFDAGQLGPYAPDMRDEIEFLKSAGMAEADGGRIRITPRGSMFVERRLLGRAPRGRIEAVERVKDRHGEEPFGELLRHIHSTCPAFAARPKAASRAAGRV